MLTFNLQSILKQRAIPNPFTLMVKAGISAHSATKILNNKTRIFRLDHIEILCQILNCTPNDLLSYTPPKNAPLPETHVLNQLTPNKNAPQLQETLKTMSIQELQEIANLIANKKS